VPPKVEYCLTEWGQALCPALDALLKRVAHRDDYGARGSNSEDYVSGKCPSACAHRSASRPLRVNFPPAPCDLATAAVPSPTDMRAGRPATGKECHLLK
jgi:hypothetical protein